MKRFMISAMNSGSGKTVVTCGLLRAFTQRGMKAESFKCGPDYIDPMFHRRVLGIPGKNLDLFLQGNEGVIKALANQTCDIAVVEAAMGYYDGLNGTPEKSAWETASISHTPVVLVLRPKGVGPTLAAQVKGMMTFRENANIKGIILADCSQKLHDYLKPVLENETGVTVFGFLPHMEEAVLESRHLGLITAEEIEDFSARFDAVARALEEHCDLDAILDMALDVPDSASNDTLVNTDKKCTIAVARDEAFCFYYSESFSALERAGAKLLYFSPLHDEALPVCDGLYLGGGYPELYAQELAKNTSMLASVREALQKRLPTVAECGGFMYLQKAIAGNEMVSFLPGSAENKGRLQRFGYLEIVPEEESMLFKPGERIPAHEFHYWDCDTNGTSLCAEKADGRSWRFGYAGPNLYAGFPHLHFGGELPLSERFVKACMNY